MLERLHNEEGMPGYYYAHVPTLSLTTHGQWRSLGGCRLVQLLE